MVTCCLLAHPLWAQKAPQEPPGTPSQPYSVYVAPQPDGETSLVEARSELERRLERNEEWFLLLDSEDSAEIVVRLIAYTTREEKRVRSIWGVVPPTENRQPSKTQVVEIVTHHNLRAQVEMFGAAKSMMGSGVRMNGGSARDAARDLAKRIEAYCKENHWSLNERRRTSPGQPLDDPHQKPD